MVLFRLNKRKEGLCLLLQRGELYDARPSFLFLFPNY